ncbi:hypothetical protein FEM48_Zijuj06G0077600 [Ziziphus jujuba var. spinosa]|uniref:Calcium uniporter protein C-terminal domain-containing protein n=1 Tax=Ziziphus jujuba var. spinosa TaxID=714518 RepID=A0A978V818_ZIZJJ|nr:hypothetical protein FEM48_Zijuj06G0077600 [Ziziphus jujuba var. spinosa]
MGLRKMLAKRLFDSSRVTSPSVTLQRSPLSSPSPRALVVPPNAAKTSFHREYLTSSDSSDKGFFRRFLHRKALDESATRLPDFFSLQLGENLRDKLRGINIPGGRIRLDDLSPPAPDPAVSENFRRLSVDDARKILRLSQVEKLKEKLRDMPQCSISLSEFVRICVENCENEDQGAEYAKMLDLSGNVIVLGNIVFLRPEQVAKSMETIISQTITTNDPRKKELEQLEKQKIVIEQKARELVQRELYCGLGFVLIQTLAAMRLTFWELSWDVMEPICFFVTSLHFALGYAFFLRTSSEPTFQGYFHRRFKSKQKELMQTHKFDVVKYTQLRKAFYPNGPGFTSSDLVSPFNQEGSLLGSFHR